MADSIRIKSNLPLALRISEPHPNPERPGDSPSLKQGVLYPGVNEGIDPDLFKAWSAANTGFVASAADVEAGRTEGKIYEMAEDEPGQEFGFEPALKRAAELGKDDAAKGSTVTDPGLVKGDDMRTGATDARTAPVLTAAGGAPVKLPTNDANLAQGKPAEKAPAAAK